MTPTADQIADRAIKFLGARTMLSTGTREEFRKLLIEELAPLAPRQQAALSFADDPGLKGQNDEILKLLRERRSAGATNAELAKMALKYTSRVNDLRKAGYRIDCERLPGRRTTIYRLYPTDW